MLECKRTHGHLKFTEAKASRLNELSVKRVAGKMENTSSRAEFCFTRRQWLFFAHSQYVERQALPIFDFCLT